MYLVTAPAATLRLVRQSATRNLVKTLGVASTWFSNEGIYPDILEGLKHAKADLRLQDPEWVVSMLKGSLLSVSDGTSGKP